MLQIKNTLGGGKPEGLYAWKKSEIGSELKEFNKSVSTLPYNFYGGSAVILNNEIHILGSMNSETKHYKWDGTSWTSVSTLPYRFNYSSAVVLNNEIHILGSGTSTTKHYKWDGSSWTSVGTLPYDFYRGSAVVLNGEIHILGSGNSSYNFMHYKFDGTSWTSVSTLPYSFYEGSAVVYNNEIHILGSNSTGNTRKYHYRFNGSSWVSVSTLPYSFYEGSAVVFNNEIHLLGGNNDKTAHYKWDGSSWTSVGTLPYNFVNGLAVVYNNRIHILGSENSSYYKAHYLIIGCVPVYTFLDYIVSDKETAYPDGGEKGGYYYEKVDEGLTPEMFGCTKMAVDTFTLTSNTTSNNYTISHSLGTRPKYFIIIGDYNTPKSTNGIYSVMGANHGLYTDINYASVSYWSSRIETSYAPINEISSTSFMVTNPSFRFVANVKYTVITMA